jgi:hypothetical protein
VLLLCREHDLSSLYLGAMITGTGIFIGCGYGSHTGIAPATLSGSSYARKHAAEGLEGKKRRQNILTHNRHRPQKLAFKCP